MAFPHGCIEADADALAHYAALCQEPTSRQPNTLLPDAASSMPRWKHAPDFRSLHVRTSGQWHHAKCPTIQGCFSFDTAAPRGRSRINIPASTDTPLNAEGEGQARQLAARLKDEKLASVFTSPLQRARRTCELAGFAARAEDDADLVEWNYGDYEGRVTVDIGEATA